MEQEMLKELNAGSWEKMPARKRDESAVTRLMDFTKWRRLVLPAHKQAGLYKCCVLLQKCSAPVDSN